MDLPYDEISSILISKGESLADAKEAKKDQADYDEVTSMSKAFMKPYKGNWMKAYNYFLNNRKLFTEYDLKAEASLHCLARIDSNQGFSTPSGKDCAMALRIWDDAVSCGFQFS
jgi:hypothetical protein